MRNCQSVCIPIGFKVRDGGGTGMNEVTEMGDLYAKSHQCVQVEGKHAGRTFVCNTQGVLIPMQLLPKPHKTRQRPHIPCHHHQWAVDGRVNMRLDLPFMLANVLNEFLKRDCLRTWRSTEDAVSERKRTVRAKRRTFLCESTRCRVLKLNYLADGCEF